MKETDRGFVTEEEGGFNFVTKDPEMDELRNEFKVPWTCPACNQLMMNWDDKFWYQKGVCCDCTINFVEGRKLDPALLKDRKALLEYVKKCFNAKKKIE